MFLQRFYKWHTRKSIHYIVLAKDHPNSLEKRLACREEHLLRANAEKLTGFILLGGATLDDINESTMDGSFLLFNAKSRDEVENFLSTDPYVVGGVWKDIVIKRFNMAAISSYLGNK